jgi:hypothetical protein
LAVGIVGPIGRVASSEVCADHLLAYEIHFENLGTSKATVQEMLIVDVLDTDVLDLSTVSLGPVALGSRQVYPPAGQVSFVLDVDLRPEEDLIVRVGAQLDMVTGALVWSFVSLDPSTGQPPKNPGAGFLPPNAKPPEGIGSVTFSVMPKAGLTQGTTIRNQATLSFDGLALETPEWSNPLDLLAPQATVLPLPAAVDSASFTVRWEVQAGGEDLLDYSVYVSEDAGPFRPWRMHVTATADTFAGESGRSYSFYCLARDSCGNVEEVPSAPEARTVVSVSVPDREVSVLGLDGGIPNPSDGHIKVWFTLPREERAVLEVLDVAGRRMLRREVGALGPGRHALDVSEALRRPGLFFVRLTQGDRTLTSRLVRLR